MPSAFTNDIEFQKLLAGQGKVNLVRLMLEFASDAYPELDWLACLCEVDRLGEAARRRVALLGRGADLRSRLEEISRLLYEEEGFHGNQKHYYDPRNSYLNEVLGRRTGIPISLGIVYLGVAAAAGVPLRGVSTPGHFMLVARSGEETWYVDAFSGGEVLTRRACRERVESLLGEPGSVGAEHFRPASVKEIAVRVLRNLKAAYAMENQWAAVLPVQKRLALVLPDIADEQRDLGLIYLRTGHVYPALERLEAYRRQCGDCDAEAIEPYLRTARRMHAEMN